jgi:uncharacterized protein YdhG (YjbR/CyaY superfamily)
MKHDFEDVETFMASLPPEKLASLAPLRAAVRQHLPNAQEEMQWGMPAYTDSEGKMLCGFSAQKNNLAFYIGQVPEALAAELKARRFSFGKGCIRFQQLDAEGLSLLKQVMEEAVAAY